MTDNQILVELQDRIKHVARDSAALQIVGGGTKSFYGRNTQGSEISVNAYSGIVSYQPSELVVTAKAGTLLSDIQAELANNNQQLGFEPPDFGPGSTLGGVIASGFSGPCRPYRGSAQDFVLGVKVLAGDGEILNFGGQVIKNVAGFDASRLMVGSLGCLGMLLEISLKVIPVPSVETTLMIKQRDIDESITLMNQLATQPLPVSAASWCGGVTRIRLSGTENGISDAFERIHSRYPASEDHAADSYWHSINNISHQAFSAEEPLYRVSVKPATSDFPQDSCGEPVLLDWGGAMRWYQGEDIRSAITDAALKANGHVTIFRNGDRNGEVIAPVSGLTMNLQNNLKKVFDPSGIFNPGRMYRAL